MASANFVSHSYEYYECVIIVVPIVVPLAIVPILWTVNCVCGCMHNTHPQILYGMAKMFSFGEEKKHYLYGYGQQEKPPKSILILLTIKAVLLLMFGTAVFLNESLIEDGIGCHSQDWDCFIRSDTGEIRIANCSGQDQSFDDPVQCYRLAVEFSTAISEVGGIMFVAQIVITTYIVVYFSVRSITSRCLRVASASAVIFIFFIFAFAAPIAFAVGHRKLISVGTLNFKMHNIIFGVYYPLLYLVVTVPLIIRSKCTFDDYDTEYDPNTIVITVGGPTPEGYGTTGEGSVTTPPRATVQIEQGNKIHIIKVN